MTHDEETALVDDLLGLYTEWEAIEHSYRGHLGALLTRCSTDLNRANSVHRELVFDLMLHALAAEQLRACMAGVESALRRSEDRRATPS